MNIEETTKALALAQAYDNRTVGEGNVMAWHMILKDLDAADVMQAIGRHYAADTAWIMPAHVLRLAREIEQERARDARQWAPGQYGVPKERAMPELERGARLTADDVSPEVLDLLSRLRATLPDVPRSRLFPREEYWRGAQRAFRAASADDAARNPLYRPMTDADRLRSACRASVAHDSGMHIPDCPDADPLPPESYETVGTHQHSASCHGAIGELQCGHP